MRVLAPSGTWNARTRGAMGVIWASWSEKLAEIRKMAGPRQKKRRKRSRIPVGRGVAVAMDVLQPHQPDLPCAGGGVHGGARTCRAVRVLGLVPNQELGARAAKEVATTRGLEGGSRG